MTPEQLTAIHARHAAITPGKWELTYSFVPYLLWVDGGLTVGCIHNKSDAEFIAAAPDDIDTLLAYVAELEAKLSSKEILDNSFDNGKCQ